MPRVRFGYSTKYHDEPESGSGSLLLRRIVPGGPAEASGLLVGDRIIAFDGETFRFENDAQVFRSMARFEPGQAIRLTIRRGGETLEVVLKPTKATPEQIARNVAWLRRAEAAGGWACSNDNDPKDVCWSEIRSRVRESGGHAVIEIKRNPSMPSDFLAESKEIVIPPGFDWREQWPSYGIFIDTLEPGERFAIEIRIEGGFVHVEPLLEGTRWEALVLND